MPPTNTSFLTAVDLGALPSSVTQTDINDAGVNYTVYYKFTTPANCVTVALCGYSSKVAPGYRPTATLWIGPAAAPTQIFAVAAQNKPMQMPVLPATEYFIKFEKNVDTAGPETLNVNVLPGYTVGPNSGNILVNDDGLGGDGFAMSVLSPSVNYSHLGFVAGIAEGETGQLLRDNSSSLIENYHDDTVRLYNSSFAEIASISAGPGVNRPRICAQQVLKKFYIADLGLPIQLRKYSVTGVLEQTWASIGNFMLGEFGLGISNDGTIAYYQHNAYLTAIKRYDLVNLIQLADISFTPANGFMAIDILVLSNGNLAAIYDDAGFEVGPPFIRYMQPDGTLINTITLSSGVYPNHTVARLAYAKDNDTHVWAMNHPVAGQMQHTLYNLTTGAVEAQVNHYSYSDGIFTGSENTAAVLGASVSCPFMVMATGPQYGILKIVPNKRTDHNGSLTVNIPDPTFKTGLLP